MKILALIPARSGSKGIAHKNIRPFCGRPLIAYTIDCAKKSGAVDRVMVSTDDEEIARVAREHGAEVPFLRPTEMAGDTSSVMDAVLHHLDTLKATEGYEPTHVLLLQVTSPLREPEDIVHAIERFQERDADSLISVCRTESLLFVKDLEDHLRLLPNDIPLSSNRQENPAFYKPDGCMIYLIKTDVLRREKSFLGGKLIGYEIDRWRAVDLDEPQDFVVGEMLYPDAQSIHDRIDSFR